MRKMYFLGQSASFKIKKTLRFLFSFGTQSDFDALKQDLAQKYNVPPRSIYLFHTGRSALALALKHTVKKSPNNSHEETEAVAITSLTCYAVVQAVRAAGFIPIYLDINPKNLHFDGKILQQALKIHPNIKAVVIQNNLGYPADLPSIEKIAKEHGLVIIEDLAHSLSLVYSDGRQAGQVGDAVVLSFGKGKALDAVSGGALILRKKVTTSFSSSKIANLRPKLTDSIRDRFYPLFGLLIRFFYYFQFRQINFGRLFTSLLLKIHWIKKSADAELDLSRRLTFWQAKYIRKEFKNLPVSSPTRSFYFVKDRSKTLVKLKRAGFIMDDIWYDTPVAPSRYFKDTNFKPEECPVATEVAKHIVNLPTFYSIFELSQARILIHEDEIEIKTNPSHLPVITGFDNANLNTINLNNTNPSKISSRKTPHNQNFAKKPLSEEDYYKQYPLANFLQSTKWQEYNQKIGRKAILKHFTKGSVCLMIIRDAKRGRFLEISNGPLLDWADQSEVNLVFSQIYQFAKKNHCVFIRFRPALENTEENHKLLSSLPFVPASFHLGAEDTVHIDLAKSEQELLADFRRQTRYEVRRAEKNGLKVKSYNTKEIYQEFHKVQLQTAKRQHFIPPTFKELNAIRQIFNESAKIYVSYDQDMHPIAYGLVLADGIEGAYYEAASTDLNRKLGGAYILQWQIIKDLKKQGIKRYNLWGIAPDGQKNHRYSGVTTFKTGFGGRKFFYIHAQDIPIKKFHYRLNRLIELCRKKRRHLT